MTRPLCAGLAASMLVLLIGALFGVIPAACAAAGMTLLFILHKNAAKGHKLLCIALVGWALASVSWYWCTAALPASRLDGATALVKGEVVSVSRSGEHFQTAIVRLDSVTAAGVTTHPRTRLSLVLTTGESLTPGDGLSLETTLSFAPASADEPWLARYYRSSNLLLTARNGENLELEPGSMPLMARMEDWREALCARTQNPLARAVLFGDREGMDEHEQTLFQKTGMTHILTFSGTHFAAIAAMVTMLLSWVGLHRRQTAAVLLAITFGIMALMGFVPSVSRAGIMLLISYAGVLLFRQADGLTSLFAAGFVLCALRPYLIESTGFLLTFLSTLGILLLAGPLSSLFAGLLPWRGRLWRGICSMTAVTVAATLATAPVLLLSFGELSTLALPANLLTYFPIMALMLCSMASLLLPLPPLLWAVEGLEQLSYALLEWLCSFRGGILYADSAALLVAYAGIAGLVGVCFAHRRDKGQDHRFALLCALVLTVGAIAAAPAQSDALVVTMIDVGQGMSVLVQDGGVNVLVDCGSESVQDAPERIVRALQSRGVYSLDTLVLTHLHEDHISALESVADSFPVGEIIVGMESTWMVEEAVRVFGVAVQKDIPLRTVKPDQNQVRQLGESSMTVFCAGVLFPPQEENNRSLLVRIDRGQSSLLLTGDLEREGELALLEDPDKAPLLAGVDVLQVAHHGANTSSTPDFLLRSMPAIALISVGENSYGHPEEEVLQRLESLDAHIFSTKENATVELSTAGDGLFIVHTARGGTT